MSTPKTPLFLFLLLTSAGCISATSVGWLYATSFTVDLTVEEGFLASTDDMGPVGVGLVINEGGFGPVFLVCRGSDGRVAFRFDEQTWEPADGALVARSRSTDGTNIVNRECPEIAVHGESRRIVADGFVCEGEIESVPPEWFGEVTARTEPRTLDETEADCHFNFFGLKEEASPNPVEISITE